VKEYNPYSDIAPLYASPYNGKSLSLRRFLYILGDTTYPGPVDYYLDLEAASEEGDAQVVQIPKGKDSGKTLSGGTYYIIREMLCLWAVEKLHLPQCPHSTFYVHARERQSFRAEDLACMLEKMGFQGCLIQNTACSLSERMQPIGLCRPPTHSCFAIRVGMGALKAAALNVQCGRGLVGSGYGATTLRVSPRRRLRRPQRSLAG